MAEIIQTYVATRTIRDDGTTVLAKALMNSLPEAIDKATEASDGKTPSAELWLKAPDGSRWKVVVDDLGILSTSKA